MKQTKFEFGLNLFGVQTSLENLVNSPKFYLTLIFWNLNLDGRTSTRVHDRDDSAGSRGLA
jgi:hypothetical protein